MTSREGLYGHMWALVFLVPREHLLFRQRPYSHLCRRLRRLLGLGRRRIVAAATIGVGAETGQRPQLLDRDTPVAFKLHALNRSAVSVIVDQGLDACRGGAGLEADLQRVEIFIIAPEEAVATLSSYTAYFGTYTVNEAEGYLIHHLQGNVRPPDASNDNKRVYEFSDNRLILMPPIGDSGVQLRIVWQQVPDLADAELTATHQRLFGFYRIGKVERWTMDGTPVPVDQFDNAFIIYMPSGHMAVHLMRPNRPVYTGGPTPEQALGAIRTYGSYFGPFSVHEEEGYLVHHRIGNLNPGQAGTNAQRFYELTDTALTLRPPPRVIDGRELQTALTWERLN